MVFAYTQDLSLLDRIWRRLRERKIEYVSRDRTMHPIIKIHVANRGKTHTIELLASYKDEEFIAELDRQIDEALLLGML